MNAISADQYELSWEDCIRYWQLTFVALPPYHHTRFFPRVSAILKAHLPIINESYCRNNLQIPFVIEQKSTEIAHLLEHILLEHLCLNKLSDGHTRAEFSGNTTWYKNQYPPFSFTITIERGAEDAKYFELALSRSLWVLDKIYKSTPNAESLPLSAFSKSCVPAGL